MRGASKKLTGNSDLGDFGLDLRDLLVGELDNVDSLLQPVDLVLDEEPLLSEQLVVVVLELEEGLRGREHVPALELEEELGGVLDGQVHVGHVRGDRLPQLGAGEGRVLEVPHRDRVERLRRPGVEEVDHGARDEPGELPGPRPENVPDRREAQDRMHVLLQLIHPVPI